VATIRREKAQPICRRAQAARAERGRTDSKRKPATGS
jgi:hypothetical protein